jgi:hypothetical protein
MDLVFNPVLNDIASVIASVLSNNGLFGYYDSSHLFVLNSFVSSFNISTFSKGLLENELKEMLDDCLEKKIELASVIVSNESIKDTMQSSVGETSFL